MRKCKWFSWWLGAQASLLVAPVLGQYASQVVDYRSGTGAAGGYTDPEAALGEPSRITPGEFGGEVDPFAPAYLKSQLVSLGVGGSLTVKFSEPVRDLPAHPFGLDFQILGGAGFIVTNAFDADFNYVGTPATDGTLFGKQTGTTRVSVSADGEHFFTLDPALAPAVEALFPTDGKGSFALPVSPSVGSANFAGLTLAEVRALYAGSGGGAGYDLSWARDENGQPVELSSVNFVRVESLTGKTEIDGFSAVAVVPEPTTWLLTCLGLFALGLQTRNGSIGGKNRSSQTATQDA